MKISDFNTISVKYGSFNVEELLMNQHRVHSIYKYDSKNCIEHLDGVRTDELDALVKSNTRNFQNIWAGYKTPEDFLIHNMPIDVFLLNEKLLSEKDLELKELLVFHEICHLLEKTGLYANIDVNLSESDFIIGDKLQKIANQLADIFGYFEDRDHNREFGALLNYFFNKFDPDKRHRLLGKSMIKNFLEDYSDSFILT